MWNALIRIWHFHVTTLKMADTSQPRPVNQRVIRDRLSMWEAKTNPTAPLTAKQKDALIELTAIAAERPVPPEVRIFVEAMFVIFQQIELWQPPTPTPTPHPHPQRICCVHNIVEYVKIPGSHVFLHDTESLTISSADCREKAMSSIAPSTWKGCFGTHTAHFFVTL